jgi:putative hydrolase of the HAD superfamily
VGALSNTIQEHALLLQRRGVYQTFNPVILSCQVGMRKPNADIYRKAAELCKTKPTRCLLIDDLPENVDGAQKAGYQAILYKGDANELRHELHRLGLL